MFEGGVALGSEPTKGRLSDLAAMVMALTVGVRWGGDQGGCGTVNAVCKKISCDAAPLCDKELRISYVSAQLNRTHTEGEEAKGGAS